MIRKGPQRATKPKRTPPKAIIVPEPNRTGIRSINEKQERQLLKANDGKAHIVDVYDGPANRGTTLTVHGINDSPDSMRQLALAAKRRGHDVKTLVYDDQKSRLGKTSDEFATQLNELSKNTKGTLTIQAHSMGGRISVDALRKLQKQGVLDKNIKLDLINPVLGGLKSANSSRFAPTPIGKMIPGVIPGKDMGTNSKFQKELEQTELPKNVKTKVYVGDRDDLVDPRSPNFKSVLDGLRAKLEILPGDNHDTALKTVANKKS